MSLQTSMNTMLVVSLVLVVDSPGSAVTGNGQYSKMSFMHDYILGQKDDEGQVTENGPTAKLRMAFCAICCDGQS